jgi:hypothetical protein
MCHKLISCINIGNQNKFATIAKKFMWKKRFIKRGTLRA